MKLSFEIVTEPWAGGLSPAGDVVVANRLRVIAKDQDGKRWAHSTIINTAYVAIGETGIPHLHDVTAEAMKKANAIVEHAEFYGITGWHALPDVPVQAITGRWLRPTERPGLAASR